MASSEQSCRECSQKLEPGEGELCVQCESLRYPSIQDRGGKWSPLALGVTSLLCDPFMIPSVMAAYRGFSELREVAKRERAGHFEAEHLTVRTGAVWGIVLAVLRPAIALVLFASVVVAEASRPAPTVVDSTGFDELAEILRRIEDEDPVMRRIAARHLAEVGPELDALGALRVLSGAERATSIEARAALVEAALSSGHAHEPAPAQRLTGVYPRLPRDTRGTVLAYLAEVDDGAVAHQVVPLALSEGAEPPPPWLPEDTLSHAEGAPGGVVAPLLDLPVEHPYHDAALRIGAARCSLHRRVTGLFTVRDTVIADWERRRDALTRFDASLEHRLDPTRLAAIDAAVQPLRLLGCLDGETVDAVLEAALHETEPRLAMAALTTMQQRGQPASAAVVERLAADPITRGPLDSALRDADSPFRMPPTERSGQRIAVTDTLSWLVTERTTATAVRWIERHVSDGRELHIVEVEGRPTGTLFAVVGPYDLGDARSMGAHAVVTTRTVPASANAAERRRAIDDVLAAASAGAVR